MEIQENELIDILVKNKFLKPEDGKRTLEEAGKSNQTIEEYLLSNKLITRDLLGQALGEFFKLPYADLNSNPPDENTAQLVPTEIAQEYRIIGYKQKADTLVLATDEPEKVLGSIDIIKSKLKKAKLQIAYALPEDIDTNLLVYKESLANRLIKISQTSEYQAPEILDEILIDALQEGSSDIHFEPVEEKVVIRYRIDGLLEKVATLERSIYENIVNRVKVLANLRVDEHFGAQDGAIRYYYDKEPVDMRVSIAPVIDGEKISIRMLSSYVRKFGLEDLGLGNEDKKIVQENSKKPFGMILTVGPTGSGKTTTLYALLKLLNNEAVNITTIEDPVEYKVDGLNQIQVNPQTNLTFAKGLKSIVRQDPDIVLVGEIRDKETAEIAVNAAMTGHLLLSTFHANDAATSIPRLLDMGIEPFLLASSIELIIAQRLVRRICQKCRHSESISKVQFKKKYPGLEVYFKEKNITLYQGKGCAVCNHTGYQGRVAIFQLIQISEEIRDLILEDPASNKIWEKAKTQGSRSFFEDGIDKVKAGVTTLEELQRTAQRK